MNERADIFKVIIIILSIIIIIGSFIFGNVYKKIELKDIYKGTSTSKLQDYMYEERINMPVVICMLISGAILVIIMSLLCCILKSLEEIDERIYKFILKCDNKNNDKSEKNENKKEELKKVLEQIKNESDKELENLIKNYENN